MNCIWLAGIFDQFFYIWKNSAKRVLQLLRRLSIIFGSTGRGLKANTTIISLKCVHMGHLLRSTPRYQKTFTPDKMGLHDLHLACVWLAGIFDQFHRQGGRVDSNVYTKIHQKKPLPSNLRCDIWTTKLNLHLGIKELQHWDKGLCLACNLCLRGLQLTCRDFKTIYEVQGQGWTVYTCMKNL